MNIKKTILLLFQGMLVGTGAILPGVSGGVLCAAFGIYEPMMSFLSSPVKGFKKYWKILVPAGIGGAVGFILLAGAVEALLRFSEAAAMVLFCGLICGTLPQLSEKASEVKTQKHWVAFAVALIFSFTLFKFLDGDVTGSIEPNFFWYIFCGVIWGLSMVVPGLSSSSILLFLGLYEPMTRGISGLDFGVLLPLGLGFIAALVLTAKGVNYIIKNYSSVFSKTILGFVISSVLVIMPIPTAISLNLLWGIILFAAGFVLAVLMSKAESKLED